MEHLDWIYNNLSFYSACLIFLKSNDKDFIRKEFYINAIENNLELNKIGVIPIFEKLRRENGEHKRIAVLTDSFKIIYLHRRSWWFEVTCSQPVFILEYLM